jgi:hypothetical protein
MPNFFTNLLLQRGALVARCWHGTLPLVALWAMSFRRAICSKVKKFMSMDIKFSFLSKGDNQLIRGETMQ